MKKKNFALYLIVVSLVSMSAWASSKENSSNSNTVKKSEDKVQQLSGNKKILVAYFSHTGNTREIAGQIHKSTGSDIFEIQAVKIYPDDYEELKKVAKQELNSGYKPSLKNKINIKPYEIIFIGYPIWWGTFPAPVKTFLSENDLSGKTIVPFCTHEGSGSGRSEQDIKKLCPKASILKGIAIRGGSTGSANAQVSEWIDKLVIF